MKANLDKRFKGLELTGGNAEHPIFSPWRRKNSFKPEKSLPILRELQEAALLEIALH